MQLFISGCIEGKVELDWSEGLPKIIPVLDVFDVEGGEGSSVRPFLGRTAVFLHYIYNRDWAIDSILDIYL
jgi:hypothetical protein